jgi:S-DNA-T family DNA segregation ATPase FtsK/SpoIIIE
MIAEWFAKQRMKAVVSQVFKNGDLGITYSYGQNNGKIYPEIRKVKFDYEKKTAICYFSIPAGMDPKEVKKKKEQEPIKITGLTPLKLKG